MSITSANRDREVSGEFGGGATHHSNRNFYLIFLYNFRIINLFLEAVFENSLLRFFYFSFKAYLFRAEIKKNIFKGSFFFFFFNKFLLIKEK